MIAKYFVSIQKVLAVQIIMWSVFTSVLPNIVFAQSYADSTTVRTIIQKYQGVWDTHDSHELAKFFTDDADLIMGTWPHITGRKAIQAMWQSYFKRQEPGRKLRININSFKIITDEVILINVTTTTWGHDDKGEELQSRKFRGTWVLNQQTNRDWHIVAMLGLPTVEDRIIRSSDH